MGKAAAFVAEHRLLRRRTEVLVREFHPALSAGEVITTVTRCQGELLRSGVRHGLATAAEAMARTRLEVAAVP